MARPLNYNKWDHIEVFYWKEEDMLIARKSARVGCVHGWMAMKTCCSPNGFLLLALPLSHRSKVSDDEDDTHPNVDTPSLFKWRHEARLQREAEQREEKAKRQAQAKLCVFLPLNPLAALRRGVNLLSSHNSASRKRRRRRLQL
jgi:hypothetical protein